MTRRTWTCATCRIEHTCTLSVVALSDHSSHHMAQAARTCLSQSSHPWTCAAFLECFLYLFPFQMTDGDSMTINNLRDFANGTFVTLDDYLPLTSCVQHVAVHAPGVCWGSGSWGRLSCSTGGREVCPRHRVPGRFVGVRDHPMTSMPCALLSRPSLRCCSCVPSEVSWRKCFSSAQNWPLPLEREPRRTLTDPSIHTVGFAKSFRKSRGLFSGRPVVDMWTQISARCDAAQDDLSRNAVTLAVSSHVLRQDQTGFGVPTDSSTSANLRHLLSTARKAIFFSIFQACQTVQCNAMLQCVCA